MKFEEVVPHLRERGVARRKSWYGFSLIVFGMDNICHEYLTGPMAPGPRDRLYTFCLADLCAEDWEIIDLHWDTGRKFFFDYWLEHFDFFLLQKKLNSYGVNHV
jgi:hypothetical protein